jgi:hypothetical protein
LKPGIHREIWLKLFRADHGREQIDDQQYADNGDDDFHKMGFKVFRKVLRTTPLSRKRLM